MSNTSATFNLGTSAKNYTIADSLGTYSGVNLWLTDDAAEQFTQEEIENLVPGGTFTLADEEGNETAVGYKSNPWSSSGRVLDIINPFGTKPMANNILASLRQTNGIALNYSPFNADAIIPPNFEIGDAVLINGEHHGIYNYTSKGSHLPLSTIQAPSDEEVDHEYPFKSATKSREITRKFANIVSQFQIANGKIAAKVSQEGSDDDGTFGWSLTHKGFYINNGEVRADGTDLFSFTKDGLTIRGTIKADSGYIGGTNGFVIQNGKLYSGKSSFSSTANGVYIGTDGISLGSGFKVSSSGSLTATSGSFGSLSVNSGGNTVGGYYGNLGGCGGNVSSGLSIAGTGYNMGGVVNSIGSLNNRVSEIYANYINTNNLEAKIAQLSQVRCKALTIGNYGVYRTPLHYVRNVVGGSPEFATAYVWQG